MERVDTRQPHLLTQHGSCSTWQLTENLRVEGWGGSNTTEVFKMGKDAHTESQTDPESLEQPMSCKRTAPSEQCQQRHCYG